MAKSKKERKTARKQDKQRRAVAKEKRRRIRSANSDDTQIRPDDTHPELFPNLSGSSSGDRNPEVERPGNPEIHAWWKRYMKPAGNGRADMVIERLREPLDDEWREALFPEAVLEAERNADSDRYFALLDLLAREHRPLYRTGLSWFLRSRVTYLLTHGLDDKVADIVSADAVDVTETGDAIYGTVTMLRLANLESEADALANAAFRVMDTEELMPWAANEIFYWVFFQHLRRCIDAGASDDAIDHMEAEIKKIDANMDADVVEIRRQIVRGTVGKESHQWERDELLGDDERNAHNRYLLGYEFMSWLRKTLNCTWSAADELRGLIAESQAVGITMRDYLDGVSKTTLDEHLVSHLRFMSLNRFKAPAALIAVTHFVRFLAERDLVTAKSLRKSQKAISALDTELRRVLQAEWQSFQFLDRLRSELR